MKRTILLIDDKDEFLKPLTHELKKRVGNGAHVEAWVPRKTDGFSPAEAFTKLLEMHDVRLVVTDYDLTEQGQLGFFGATVVDWCQNRGIPVGDFSRGHASSLATEPNLFELRVPMTSNEAAATYIATVYHGFVAIRDAIENDEALLKQRSPAAALAVMLGAKGMESQFSQYGIRYGGANSALIDRFAATAAEDVFPEPAKKTEMLSYIMGHLLVNAVLRFPGPIMSEHALAAYLAIDPSEHDKYAPLFVPALYSGPFAALHTYYWTSVVDEVLAQFDDKISEDSEFESSGEQNRTLVEAALGGIKLARSPRCKRCDGKNGGFLCPFTGRAVCQRPDCSVVSNVWIPAGARLSRFERDFYDEWAPILGM